MTGLRFILIALLVPFLFSCAAATPTRPTTVDLVAVDYTTMSDQELQSHYARLSDQLARESRAERLSAAGRPTRPGASQDPEAVAALRERWNQVRQEMRQRELLP